MYNLTIRLKTPRNLPQDLDKRQEKLIELVETLNKKANTGNREFSCFNLASEYLQYNKSQGNKIGWGFYNEKEIELQFGGVFNNEELLKELKKKRYQILNLEEEFDDILDGFTSTDNSTRYAISQQEYLDRIAIEKAHEHEDEYCEVIS